MSDARLTLPNRRVALECAVKIGAAGIAHFRLLPLARAFLEYLGDEEFPARVAALQAAAAYCPADTTAENALRIAREFEDFLSGATPDLAQDS